MASSVHSTDSAGAPPLDFTTFHSIINGEKVASPKTRHNINPATGEPNAEVPVVTNEQVDEAVRAARTAFPKWRNTSLAERQAAISSFAKALAQYKEEFAQLLTKEQGKPLDHARTEIDFAGLWLNTLGQMSVADEVTEENDERKVVVRYTPIGVCVGIVPWNYPILLAAGKLAPALVTGNVLIIKPSPFTPYCNLKMMELAQGYFPPGVLQCLSGDDSLGPILTEHPDVDKVSFTGSSATGKLVMASCAKTLKRVTLELGGNDPAIVCADVDVDSVAPQVAALAFLNSGQICIAIKRIYVHEDIYDKFREGVIAYAKSLVVGDGAQEKTTIGPVQNSMQYGKVKSLFDQIGKDKWTVAYGGTNPDTKGYFIQPTVIDNPPEKSRIVVEEPFGPIVPLLKWKDEADVIARANDTKMGLGSSVWSKDLDRAKRIGEQLEAGSVWINAHFAVTPTTAFGGHKNSGIGHEWGQSGLKSWCNVQAMYLKKV